MTPLTNKIFFVMDSPATSEVVEAIEPLKQIDSVFVYYPTSDAAQEFSLQTHSYLLNWCENEAILIERLTKSREELEKQTEAFSMYNKKEKATRDLSKEAGSFLFFQLFKIVLTQMPSTDEAKKTMVTTCRNYYRGNITELNNIDEFEKTYRSAEAIPWYTKETFVYKYVNSDIRKVQEDFFLPFL